MSPDEDLTWLNWHLAECNEAWEHSYGIDGFFTEVAKNAAWDAAEMDQRSRIGPWGRWRREAATESRFRPGPAITAGTALGLQDRIGSGFVLRVSICPPV
jgi:hypothetical protein